MKEVLISLDFDDLLLRLLLSFGFHCEDVSNTRNTQFHRLSKHLAFRQNTLLRVVFSTLSPLFDIIFLKIKLKQPRYSVDIFSTVILIAGTNLNKLFV